MKSIIRKSMLYKTGVEYGDYTLNHVLGCSHGCKYPCYAFMMAKRFGRVSSYDEWIQPQLASNTLDILDKEIPKLKDKIDSVQLCFTTDPFMIGYSEISEVSLKIIEKLNENNIKCIILTKGLLPSTLSDYSPNNEYGITLVSLDEEYRIKMEPGASPYKDRIDSLRVLNRKGCKTWVSIEPYPTPNLIEQNLDDLLQSVSFTDKIIFGRTNYNKQVTAYKENKAFYNEKAREVIDFCNNNNINYHIKNGTLTDA